MHLLRVATYNIHKGRGLDQRVQIERIAEVLREIDADIIALQEVLSIEGKKTKDHQARFIACEMGFHYRIGENRRLQGGAYGNVTYRRAFRNVNGVGAVFFEEKYCISDSEYSE